MSKGRLQIESRALHYKEIHPNKGQVEGLPKNPRFIRDEKYSLLKKSIEQSPEMLELREVLVYDNNGEYVIIGGNMRFRACVDLGFKTIPCKIIPKETPIEKLKEYIIKDNSGFGEWDFNELANEWDEVDLKEWGVDLPVNTDIDYSILEELNNDRELEAMAEGVKKSIQIEFNPEHYEEAYKLVQFWRERGAYVGMMLVDLLKNEKNKL